MRAKVGRELSEEAFSARRAEAEEQLLALIHGVDPRTGQTLPGPGVLAYQEVKRSLVFALEELRGGPRTKVPKRDEPARAGNRGAQTRTDDWWTAFKAAKTSSA